MNLKKSDKMIAGIAVLVLIIAAVGIVLYSEDKDDVTLDDSDGKMMSYDVKYDNPMNSAQPDNTNYKLSTKKNGAYNGVVDIGEQNVKSVTFVFDYTDKFTGLLGFGILGRKIGQDTITVTVTDMNDNEIGSGTIKGSGNLTITDDDVTSMISTSPIDATSEAEAKGMLEDRYENNPTNVTYKIKVTIAYGELRIIKKLRERIFSADSFTLEVNYDYYHYYVGEPDDNGDDIPPTGGNQGSQTWAPMAYPGKN